MEISFVIPTRNRPGNIERTVKGLLNKAKKFSLNFEIVVRDTSDEENIKLLDLEKKSRALNYIYVNESTGAAENLRSAIDESKGDYIKVLNDSCIVTDSFFIEFLSVKERIESSFILWCSLLKKKSSYAEFSEFVVSANIALTWFNALGFSRNDWFFIKSEGIDKAITIHEFSWVILNIASRYKSFYIYDVGMIKNLPIDMKGDYSFYDQFGMSYLAKVLELDQLNFKQRILIKYRFLSWCLRWEKKSLSVPNNWDFSSRSDVLRRFYGVFIERVFLLIRYVYVLF